MPGMPYPGGPFPAYQDHKTNNLAVGSFASSLVGLFFWPLAMAAVIVGFTALNQIKTTGERGHGLAVAGTVIGGVALALFVLVAVGNHMPPR